MASYSQTEAVRARVVVSTAPEPECRQLCLLNLGTAKCISQVVPLLLRVKHTVSQMQQNMFNNILQNWPDTAIRGRDFTITLAATDQPGVNISAMFGIRPWILVIHC